QPMPQATTKPPDQPSDLQVGQEMKLLWDLLDKAHEYFRSADQFPEKIAAQQAKLAELGEQAQRAADQLRKEIAAEQGKLSKVREQTQRQVTRTAAMAGRAAAAERACGGHREMAEAVRRDIEVKVREVSATLKALEQAGGLERLARLRDELHQVME